MILPRPASAPTPLQTPDAARRPASDRFATGTIGFFLGFLGSWTIAVQIGVLGGITFAGVRLLLPACLLAGAVAALFAGQADPLAGPSEEHGTSVLPPPADREIVHWCIATGLLSVMFFLAAKIDRHAPGSTTAAALFAGCALAIVVAKLAGYDTRTGRSAMPRAPTPIARADQLAVLAIFALAVALPLFFHRADDDDANFLNIATGMMADARPVIVFDHIIGAIDQPVMLPTYRIEVFLALPAAISWWTGLEVVSVAHLVWPPFACLVIACAFYLFARRFAGKAWLVAFVASLAVLLIYGGVPHGYGNFSFTRAQHGKSLLFVGIVPLVYVQAAALWSSGRLCQFIGLALILVAGTGLSANGVYVGPFALFMAGTALLMAGPLRVGRFVILGLAGVWPIIAALSVVLTTGALPSEQLVRPGTIHDLVDVFGRRQGLIVFPLSLGVAYLFSGWAARFFLGIAALFVLLIANPVVDPLWAAHVTGNLDWRLIFALPAPGLAGLAVSRIWTRLPVGVRTSLPAAAAPMVLLLLAAMPFSTLDVRNRTRFGLFDLDVWPPYYDVVRLAPEFRANPVVLAPLEFSVWVSTLRNPSPVVVTKSAYLDHYRHTRPAADIARRIEASDFLSSGTGFTGSVPRTMQDLVDYFCVSDVVLTRRNPLYEAQADALRKLGFDRLSSSGPFVHFRGVPGTVYLFPLSQPRVPCSPGRSQSTSPLSDINIPQATCCHRNS